MNKIFLIFLSMTLINTMTVFSNRNMNNQISQPEIENEIVEEMPEEETAKEDLTEENPDDTTNTTESSIEDEQTPDTDEETEVVEEDSEEDVDILPGIDIELTDEEKALVFKYIGKIDINYLMGLTSDGITEDENILIIEHLKERLTLEEYEEVEDLIIRFIYSLE